MSALPSMTVSFPDHVSLLTSLLDRREQIVGDIETRLLNVQGKAPSRRRNRADLERMFSAPFFEAAGIPGALSALKGQLAAAHLADGFEPVMLEQRSHQLEPADLLYRAYDHWDRHRWPGRNGRLAFAQALYSIFILQQLEHLSLRIWDEGNVHAGDRLHEIQSLLDTLNATSGSNVFIRDARWLIQTAQGALTRHLQPYFKTAERISSSLGDADRLEVHKAGGKLAGGHLRSQLRYRAAERGLAADDPNVLAITRNSNSMDAALLVADLVPLLEAYKLAVLANDGLRRRELADAILQGVSADPELLLARLDVLGPSTMIEDVFLEREGSAPRFTSAGSAHVDRLGRYRGLVKELARSLDDDVPTLGESDVDYSPFGIAYGFCADIVSNMAMDSLLSQSSFGVSLEDMFAVGGTPGARTARVRAWQQLPAKDGERERFEHSSEWAGQVLERTRRGLRELARRHAAAEEPGLPANRLFVVSDSCDAASLSRGLPKGIVSAQEHYVTSDLQRALANGGTAFPKSQILLDRKEGRFLASVEVDGKWFAVSKALLTACLCQGKDALIADVPEVAIDTLKLACPELIVVASR